MATPTTRRHGLATGLFLTVSTSTLAMNAAHAAPRGDCTAHWDTAIGNPGLNGPVTALATLPNGDIVAGGGFTTAGETPANRVARWDGEAWHALGDGLGTGAVFALAVSPDGDLIAGGTFTHAGGVLVNRIARWDGAAWHPLDTGMDGVVRALHVLPNGEVLAGGAFITAGDVLVNRIARWDGVAWHALGDGVNHTVYALAHTEDDDGLAIYAGGEFTEASSIEVNHIAQWTGAKWQPLGGGCDGMIRTITALPNDDGHELVVTGTFASSDGPRVFQNSAKWDGVYWVPTASLGSDTVTTTLASAGDALLYANTASPFGIAAWDGYWWKQSAATTNGPIGALTVHKKGSESGLVVAGIFTLVGNEPATRIAIWRDCPSTPVTHHVPRDFASIQTAIDAADDGDIVLVAPGSYSETINFAGKTITLQSEAGAETTIIDASGFSGPAVFIGEGSQPGTVLRGFTVTGATSTVDGTGVYVEYAAVWIDQCVITGNGGVEVFGGGLAVMSEADVHVTNCEIHGNQANGGGGVFLGTNKSARFQDCVMHNNVAAQGAAVNANLGSRSSFVSCEFRDNQAADGFPWNPWGGGVTLLGSEALNTQGYIVNCAFIENVSNGTAGGFSAGRVGLALRDCLFERNQAGTAGGGAYFFQSSGSTLIDCSFVENSAGERGGGAYITPGATLLNCSFIDNTAEQGGAVYAPASNTYPVETTLSQSTFIGNSALQGGAIFGAVFTLTDSTFIENVADEAGTIYSLGTTIFNRPKVGNCEFCDNEPGDAIVGMFENLGGNSYCSIAGDFNGDLAVDVSDLLILLAAWGDCPAKGECPADLNDDGVVDASDLLILLSMF